MTSRDDLIDYLYQYDSWFHRLWDAIEYLEERGFNTDKLNAQMEDYLMETAESFLDARDPEGYRGLSASDFYW